MTLLLVVVIPTINSTNHIKTTLLQFTPVDFHAVDQVSSLKC